MWCKCGNTKGYTCVDESDLWVCATCSKPTRQWFKSLTAMRAPADATAILRVDGHLDGTSRVTFATSRGKREYMYFHPYPQKVDMPRQDDLLVDLWAKLDQCIDLIRSGESANSEWEKARAGGIADCIATVMAPFYEDATAVLKESMKRWTSRQNMVEHESPGLAESIWHPRMDWKGHEPKAEVATKRSGKTIPESAVPTVKAGLERKLFTFKQMADTYGMSVEEVKEQLGID